MYALARTGEDEGLSEQELLAIASSPQFFRTIKKKIHYDHIIELFFDDLNGAAEGTPLPNFLSAIALHCASKQHARDDIRGMLSVIEGFTLLDGMRLEESLNLFRKARSIFFRLRRSELFRMATGMIFVVSLLLGRNFGNPQDRKFALQAAKTELSDLGPTALIHMASTYAALGEYDRALAVCAAVKRSGNLDGVPAQVVRLNSTMAWCSFQLGNYERALDLMAVTLKRPDVAQTPQLRFSCEIMLAMVYRRLGEFEKAVSLLKQAEGFYRSRRQGMMVLQCILQLAFAYEDSGQLVLAEELLERGIKEHERTNNETAAAECRNKLGQIYRRMGLYDRALEQIAGARAVFEKRRRNLDLAACEGAEAWLYVEMGRHDEARKRLDSLMERFGSLDPVIARMDYERAMGWSHAKMGQWEEARTSYQQCIETIEGLRGSMGLSSRRSSFLESRHEVYEEMIDCCLKQGDARSALEYAERLKSRSLAELLSTRDLVPRSSSQEQIEDYKSLKSRLRSQEWRLSREQDPVQAALMSEDISETRKEYDAMIARFRECDPGFDPDQTEHISHAEIIELAAKRDAAVLEFFPLKDRVAGFVIRGDGQFRGVSVVMEGYDRESLRKDVKALQDKTLMVDTLRRLYEKLIEPLRSSLEGCTRLVVIPYSEFHLIPFHALCRDQDGCRTYLLDENHISYAPSAKILRSVLNKPLSHDHSGSVAWANPHKDLPLARREAQTIAALFDWKIVPEATRGDFDSGGLDAGIIHYSGHADGNALILHSSDGDNLYDTGDIFVSLNLPHASMVTLSACDTGKVRMGKTDEYICLPSAFLHAGASTVICSLWSVSDTSTTLLMTKMYRLIQEGLGKAEALRQAQLWLKNPNNRREHLEELEKVLPWLRPAAGKAMPDTARFGRAQLSTEKFLPQDLSHPYYWASFICTGAP